jgi:hypothetical protein
MMEDIRSREEDDLRDLVVGRMRREQSLLVDALANHRYGKATGRVVPSKVDLLRKILPRYVDLSSLESKRDIHF